MKKGVYQWQGTDVKVKFGTVKIERNISKPLYWSNYEVLGLGKDRLPVLQITYKEYNHKNEQVFCISNHCGIGVRKLEDGGWPNRTHFSVPDIDFKEFTAEEWEKEKFKSLNDDIIAFREYEKKRDEWQAINYPKEYATMQIIKNACK